MLDERFLNVLVEAVQKLLCEVEIEVKEIVKNNNVVLHGVVIKKHEENVAPTIYIENYVKDMSHSDLMNNVNSIAKEIVRTYNEQKTPTEFGDIGEFLKDFSNVKPLLRIRLVNKENNSKTFETVPYMPFLDMAIIAVIEWNGNADGIATVKVTSSLLELWGYTALSDILPIAKENTFKAPYKLQNLAEMLGLPQEMCTGMYMMYVLSNTNNLHGATEICNYDAIKEIAEKLNSDLFVIPSSIHEVLLVPKTDDINTQHLTDMVQAVNSTDVSPDEVLSDHVYIFTRENGWEY